MRSPTDTAAGGNRTPAGTRRVAATVMGMLLFPLACHASLGGDTASVAADQAELEAAQTLSTTADYTIYKLTAPSGLVLREYALPSGSVFAVTWRGPTIPDLEQILGTYFRPYLKAAAAVRGSHGHSLVRLSDLVVETAGHMRAFRGKAYLPALVPQGVSADSLE